MQKSVLQGIITSRRPRDARFLSQNEDKESVASGATLIDAKELEAQLKPFSELLRELREMKAKFDGIVKKPPQAVEGLGKVKFQSYGDLFTYATSRKDYVKLMKTIQRKEEENNKDKLLCFAFVESARQISEAYGEMNEDFNPGDVEKYYDQVDDGAEQLLALWTLEARAEKLTVEEYVNRYVNF